MKRFQEQLQKKSQTLRLSVSERGDLRDRIVSYMEYHPLPQAVKDKPVKAESLVSEAYTTIKLDWLTISRYVGALAVLVLVVVPVVAERAVPGDVLYPVKVGFNEEVRSTLALSPYQKVEWETTRLERRIAEARLLASEGKLTPEVEAEMAEAVKAHNDAAQKEIASIRATDSEEAALASIALSSALTVQSESLESQLEEGAASSSGSSVVALASVVGAARESAEEATAQEKPASYERLFARLEAETTRAHEYLSTLKDAASADERRDIERRLDDIRVKINKATALEDKTEAVPLLAAALSDTRKLISFMTNIDVRTHVSVEELVPVTLTDSEKIAATIVALEKAKSRLAHVKVRMDNLPVDILEKVTFGVAHTEEVLAQAQSDLEAKEADAALTHSQEALVSATDLDLLTEPYRLETELNGEVTATTSTTTQEVIEPVEDADADRGTTTEVSKASTSVTQEIEV